MIIDKADEYDKVVNALWNHLTSTLFYVYEVNIEENTIYIDSVSNKYGAFQWRPVYIPFYLNGYQIVIMTDD